MIEKRQLKLVDSNILVYAYDNSEEDKYNIAKEFMKESWHNQDTLLSIQNLVEFYSIITRKITQPIQIDKAKQIILDYIEGFDIVKYGEKTIIGAINLQAIYKISFWDSLIAATMEENGIDTIITENERDFKKIGWIQIINPFKKLQ